MMSCKVETNTINPHNRPLTMHWVTVLSQQQKEIGIEASDIFYV